MKTSGLIIAQILMFCCISVFPQEYRLRSPNNNLGITVFNEKNLSYAVTFGEHPIIKPSLLGFEFADELPLKENFEITDTSFSVTDYNWEPVVKSKHSIIRDNYNELTLQLKEKTSLRRCLELRVRAYNDGIAFCFRLPRSENIGERKITKELTTFSIPDNPKAWIVEYKGGYASSNEAEFFEHPLNYLSEKSIAGMPLLMEYGNNCWVAITEAKIIDYPGFYLGTNGNTNQLITKLAPLPGEKEEGIKVRFHDDIYTPWRVIMIGDNPGTLIESEIIQNLNDPCAIEDPSWIKPGLSAWDHWWSGGLKMEMPVIKQYIDLASEMGWTYMLVDWQWYRNYNSPEADIIRSVEQISMPEIIKYANSKNVKILIWLYSKDVNRNSAYKTAFPLYKEWGIAGVKVDFMDREDQQMVKWYQDIIKCAAENQLLVNFHGSFKPDGIIRTWPNMITREGLMGNEYYQFSDRMNPEHNVKLAFTRMLAGQMDYTPGAFLNVRRDQFKYRVPPALVWNTKAAELSKFVIYESPLTVVCDHPDHILNQPGSDFLKIVPVVWDDIKFLGGYPGDFVAIAKRSSNSWFVGVLNNSKGKSVDLNLDFLPGGTYDLEIWADTKKSDQVPSEIQKLHKRIKAGDRLKINMSDNGGWVGVIREK